MTEAKIERGSCRFAAKAAGSGAVLRIELFHPIPSLAGATIELELLTGTTLEQAKKLADSVNERIIGIVVSTKGSAS